jgi:hypothetical protein
MDSFAMGQDYRPIAIERREVCETMEDMLRISLFPRIFNMARHWQRPSCFSTSKNTIARRIRLVNGFVCPSCVVDFFQRHFQQPNERRQLSAEAIHRRHRAAATVGAVEQNQAIAAKVDQPETV